MPLAPKRLAQAMPGTSEATIYTVPDATLTIVKNVLIANTAGEVVSAAMSIVPIGGVAGVGNRIVPSVAIPGNAVVSLDLTQIMSGGDKLTAVASKAGAVAITASGLEDPGSDGLSAGSVLTPGPYGFIENTAWTDYTPVLTASVTNPTMGTGSLAEGRYMRLGRLIVGTATIKFGTTGMLAGSGTFRVSLPVLPRTPLVPDRTVARGFLRDISAAANISRYPAVGYVISGQQYFEMAEGYGRSLVTAGAPFVWAAGDEFQFDFMYEAAL